ncbi:MAG: hypothetical protein ACRECG_03975, partial [Bradyrhizobium sp.]
MLNALVGNTSQHHRRNSKRHHPDERAATVFVAMPDFEGYGDPTLSAQRPVTFWRVITCCAVLFVMLWLGWNIVVQTASLHEATSDPQAALSWNSHQSAALNLLAAQELPDPDGNLGLARDWAQKALRY